MIVPTLSKQQVGAQPAPNGYASVDVSALSQGAGVGAGLQSLGADLGGVALDAKRQADQVATFNAEAEGRATADKLNEEYDQLDGPAAMQAAQPTIDSFEKWAREKRSKLTSDQQLHFDQWAKNTHEDLRHNIITRADGIRVKMGADALANKIQTETDSAARAGVSVYELPRTEAGGPSPAKFVLNDSATEKRWAEIAKTIDEYADANEKSLPADKETWTRLAKEKARSDFHAGVVEGLLSPSPGVPVDDRAAKVYLEKYRGEMEPQLGDKLSDDVARAYDIGEAQRVLAVTWRRHADEPGTWSDKQKVMEEEIGDNPRARSMLRESIDAVREDDRQGQADLLAEFDKRRKEGEPLSKLQQDGRWSDLTAAGQRMLESQEEAPDPVVYSEAIAQASDPETRGEFAKRDLLEIRQQLTKAQYEDLVSIRKAILEGNDKALAPLQTTEGIVSDAAAVVAAKFTDSDERVKKRADFTAKFYDAIRSERAYALEHGKPWGEEQVLAMRDRFMADVLYDKRFWKDDKGDLAAFIDPQSVDVEDIPADEVAFIRLSLLNRGLPTDDESVARAWVNLLQFDRLPE